jgi:glucokinase
MMIEAKNQGVIFGADIGGTDIKRGVGSLEGDPLTDTREISKLPSFVREGPDRTIGQIKSAVDELLSRNPDASLKAIGVACAGNISLDGVVLASANFGDQWREFHLREELQKLFKVPVTIDNDANAAVLAEHRELAKISQELKQGPGFLLTIGTGLGTGMFNGQGKLERGAFGLGVEFGHTPMRAAKAKSTVDLVKEHVVCGCGEIGCAEQYTTLSFIERELFARQQENPTHELYAIANRRDAAKKVLGKAVQGDPFCLSIIDSQARNVGLFMGELIRAYDPIWALIGGGITEASDALRYRYMRKALEEVKYLIGDDRLKKVRIDYAVLGDNAGWVGASISASELLESLSAQKNVWTPI